MAKLSALMQSLVVVLLVLFSAYVIVFDFFDNKALETSSLLLIGVIILLTFFDRFKEIELASVLKFKKDVAEVKEEQKRLRELVNITTIRSSQYHSQLLQVNIRGQEAEPPAKSEYKARHLVSQRADTRLISRRIDDLIIGRFLSESSMKNATQHRNYSLQRLPSPDAIVSSGPGTALIFNAALLAEFAHAFVEVVQYVEPFRFSDLQRFFRMLSDVNSYARQQPTISVTLYLLVVDLRNTSLFELRNPHKIDEDIAKLREYFQPAVMKGLFVPKIYAITDDELLADEGK
jgi:hypothetical protein